MASSCHASAERRLVGLTRFELVTPRLSSVCSNQLSYRPGFLGSAFGLAGSLHSRGPKAPLRSARRRLLQRTVPVLSKLDRRAIFFGSAFRPRLTKPLSARSI